MDKDIRRSANRAKLMLVITEDQIKPPKKKKMSIYIYITTIQPKSNETKKEEMKLRRVEQASGVAKLLSLRKNSVSQ